MKTLEISSTEALLRAAKWTFTTRRVAQTNAVSIRRKVTGARTGDLVLAKVIELGSHRRVQLHSGRTSDLYTADLVVAACGARYASDQFEGQARIRAKGTDLLAGGGVFGSMRCRHQSKKAPTRLLPLGLLEDDCGEVLNLDRYSLAPVQNREAQQAVAVLGSSMNAGKTTAAAALIRGLTRAGHRVAAIKATGTGAFGDYHAYQDAGAHFVADFTDAGMASTYLEPASRIEASLHTLMNASVAAGCDVAVVEFADGILQHETAELLGRVSVSSLFNACLYATGDSLSALGGQVQLARLGIEAAALTGLLARSPLAAAEATSATGLPVLAREQLCDPVCASGLVLARKSISYMEDLAA